MWSATTNQHEVMEYLLQRGANEVKSTSNATVYGLANAKGREILHNYGCEPTKPAESKPQVLAQEEKPQGCCVVL